MVSITSENDNITVQGSEVTNWKHKMYFTLIEGFSFNEKLSHYTFRNHLLVREKIKRIIVYLQEQDIAYQLDNTLQDYLEDIEAEQKAFDIITDSNASEEVPQVIDEVSSHFVRHLKPHQIAAVRHLLHIRHGANFSVPGSGKTTVVYAIWDILRSQQIVQKLIVVGPTSSFRPWEEEAEFCFDVSPSIVRLTGNQRRFVYDNLEKQDIFLTTYQTAANDISQLVKICKRFSTMVVIDESHNIKKFEGGVWSDALLSLAPFAKRRIILSGTPVPNDYLDLWTQITFLWPDKQVLNSRDVYKNSYSEKNTELIRAKIKPFIYRTSKSELGLPLPQFNILHCDLQPYQAQIYHALAVKYISELNINHYEQRALKLWRKARIVRLLQTASNPTLLSLQSEEFSVPPLDGEGLPISYLIENYASYEVPAKVNVGVNLIKKIYGEGRKVVVWTTFIHNIIMLERLLKDLDIFKVYGAIPRDDREDVDLNREQQIRLFKQSQGPAILLANPAACAESISLHKICHDAVYIDRSFNCGQYLQSLDRIHRIGLDLSDEVVYHIVLANNTIDETVHRRLIEKEQSMKRLLEDELPVGSFDVADFEMQKSEDEEAIDFEETMKDLLQYINL